MTNKKSMLADQVSVQEIMVTEVKKIPQTMRVKELIHWLAAAQVSGVPVVNEAGKLAGVVSETDIVRAQANLEEKDLSCRNFYDYDPFAGRVDYFAECGPKLMDMPVSEFMTRQVITVLPEDPLEQVVQRLLIHGIHRLLVARDNDILGIISTLDIMQALAAGQITPANPALTVAHLAPETIVAAEEDMSIRELIEIMSAKDITGLPVIRADGSVAGVISQSDIIRREAHKDDRDNYPDFYRGNPFLEEFLLGRDFDRDILARRVKEFMNQRVISVTWNTLVRDAARIMVREKVHRLIVLDQAGRITNLIGTLDIIRALA